MNDMTHDPFDRIVQEARARAAAKARTEQPAPTKPAVPVKGRQQHGRFVQKPLTWSSRLRETASPATLKLADLLLWLCWQEQRRLGTKEVEFKVTNITCAQWGISRPGKAHALKELEKLGLIWVKWRTNKNPLVVVFSPKRDADEPETGCGRP